MNIDTVRMHRPKMGVSMRGREAGKSEREEKERTNKHKATHIHNKTPPRCKIINHVQGLTKLCTAFNGPHIYRTMLLHQA